ncbi:MAG: hypothetical protein IPP02_08335 [Chitinophagaceae bacterium]|nr:hypothetical protein [Chitinophagaceae bacterium]
MAQYAPQYNLFTIIDKIRTGIAVIFWIVFILSAAPPLIKMLDIKIDLEDIISTVNIIAISLFFVLEIIVEYILIPQADSKRRDDFIDNAFGSTFSPSPFLLGIMIQTKYRKVFIKQHVIFLRTAFLHTV